MGRPRSKWHDNLGLQNPVFGLEEELIILSLFVCLIVFVCIPYSYSFRFPLCPSFIRLYFDSSKEICSIASPDSFRPVYLVIPRRPCELSSMKHTNTLNATSSPGSHILYRSNSSAILQCLVFTIVTTTRSHCSKYQKICGMSHRILWTRNLRKELSACFL